MASTTEFSRTLSLLRQERGVSQRTAAGDLGISQALLSHYENGIREPGLAFVTRACDYYNVSADFMLGRTLSRDGSMLTEEDIRAASEQGNVLRGSVLATLQSRLLAGALSVLFDLLGKLNDKEAINAASAVLGTAFYQLYRRLYRAADGNAAYFALPGESWEAGLSAADSALSEARYDRALRRLQEGKAPFPAMAEEEITKNYPGGRQSVAQILHSAELRLTGLLDSEVRK